MEVDLTEVSNERVHTARPEAVVVPDNRQRQEFDKNKLKELVEDIKELGQHTPGLCYRNESGNPVLIFGHRRLLACTELGIEFRFLIREELDPYKLALIEFSENVCRVDLTPLEKAKAIEKFHKMAQAEKGEASRGRSGGHGIRDTARYAGVSPTKIVEELEIAEYSQIPQVAEVAKKSRVEARKLIKRIKEDYARSEALRIARETSPEEEKELEKVHDEEDRELARRVKFYSPNFHTGEMEDVLPTLVVDKPFDVVLFDPPWGVDFDKVAQENSSKQNYEDSKEVVLSKMEGWLKLVYNSMAEDSHLYLFFGIRNYTEVYAMLENAGFSTNGMPLIWYKQGAHRTRNPDVWPGRSYEPIAYARKGSKILIRKGGPDVIITPAPWNKLKKSHKSAKHPDIYYELLKRSCMPGDRVLDPMGGSGMSMVAAEALRPTHKLDWHYIEKSQNFCNLAMTNVIRGYSNLIGEAIADPERGEENNAEG